MPPSEGHFTIARKRQREPAAAPRSVSTQTTAPACSATERTNAATTVHLLGGLYTAAGGTTGRGRVRFAAGGRPIRITRAFGITSEVFNVAVCIWYFDEKVGTSRQM